MIYFSADDYGLDSEASEHIQECIDKGALNKVSVFANLEYVDLNKLLNNKNIRVCLHLNLVEGKCMADACEIDLLADKDGNLRHAFGGLFKLGLFKGKKFKEQVYREIKAQVTHWKSILPPNVPFCIDSHQHTHMIPGVFKALVKVLEEEKIKLEYMRIPTEPLLPYVKTPTLYFTYNAVNIIKQWLLNFLWLVNKNQAKKIKIPTAYFMGILFSGHMDYKRVSKILPKYIKLAERDGRDIEVLFHPGYLNKSRPDFKNKNIVFKDFYLSDGRKTEYDSVIKISERGAR